MKHKFILLYLIIILYQSPLFAENKYTFSQFWDETGDFIMQPTKWDGDDYLKIGLMGVATGLTMFADQPIREAVLRDGKFDSVGLLIQGSQKYYYSPPIVIGKLYGELYSPIIFFSVFAGYSLITGDDWTRKVAYEIGQASLYGGGLTFLLKMSIGRARPFMNEGSASYHPFSSIFIQDYHSIPGGHTQASMIISTVLSRNVKPLWLKVLFYAPAALTFVSRIYQDKHWTSDDLMGAAMGYYIATWVVDKHEKVVKSDTTGIGQGLMERIQLQPLIMDDFYGLSISIRLL